MAKSKKSIERSARHEVGHLLVGSVVGFAFECARLPPKLEDDVAPGVGGYCRIKHAPVCDAQETAVRWVAHYVAGIAGETAYTSARFQFAKFTEQNDSAQCAPWVDTLIRPGKGEPVAVRRTQWVKAIGADVIAWLRKPKVAAIAKDLTRRLAQKRELSRAEIAKATRRLPPMFLTTV